jgi:hypothetical protein
MKRLGLPLLLAGFVIVGVVYAVVTPLFEVSDELWHYPMVKRLAGGLGLPVQDSANVGPWRQEGSQPPLYYAVMALATRWIDTGDIGQVRWLNPHADNGIITSDGNNNIVVHTSREAWPWHGAALAVRLVRLLSVLLGAGVVYFTYRLALELAPGQYALALAAAAFAGFTPMFVFISASVNNDTLAVFFSAAALWLMAKWIKEGERKKEEERREKEAGRRWSTLPIRELVLMGAILGGAALSKESALGLFPLVGAVVLYAHLKAAGFFDRDRFAWRAVRLSLIPCALSLLLVFGFAALVCGWWYWRNYQLYGDWLGWNAFVAIVGKRPHPASLAQLWGERVGFMQAYWGLFGGVSVPMPGWVYAALNVVAGLGLAGAGWSAMQAVVRRKVTLTNLAQWSMLVGWLVLIVIGLIRWTSATWASQGRLIFPAISAISVLIVFGLAYVSRRVLARLRPAFYLLPAVAVSFMVLLSTAVPFAIIAPHYAPPPVLTTGQISAISHRVDADFGGEMKLLGYDLETASVAPGEAVKLTLYWQSQIAMDRNWSIFLHLVDDQNVIVAQRDRYPGMGALATTLLRPGQTFADRYVISVPEAAYAPALAHLEVGLYDLQDGARLPLAGSSTSALLPSAADALALAPLAIRARPGPIPNAFRQNFGNQIELTGYTMSQRELKPSETLTLTLYWQALAPVRKNYSVFTHVRGTGDTLWAGEDGWPRKGAAPTSTWSIGAILTDTYQLTLKPDTPAGQYDVEVGLYDGATMQRLQAITKDGRPTDADFVYLSKIRVVVP